MCIIYIFSWFIWWWDWQRDTWSRHTLNVGGPRAISWNRNFVLGLTIRDANAVAIFAASDAPRLWVADAKEPHTYEQYSPNHLVGHWRPWWSHKKIFHSRRRGVRCTPMFWAAFELCCSEFEVESQLDVLFCLVRRRLFMKMPVDCLWVVNIARRIFVSVTFSSWSSWSKLKYR